MSLRRILASLLIAATLPAWGDDAFTPGDSWAESMAAARAACLAQQAETSFEPYRSETVRGGDEPVHIECDVTGLETLTLEATAGPDNYDYDQAIWGEPELVKADGKRVALTILKPESVSVGWGNLRTDKNHQDKPLRIGSRTFERGFWAHAPSRLAFNLGGQFVRFEAWAGIDTAAGKNGSAEFIVDAGENIAGLVWQQLAEAFPEECARFESAVGHGAHLRWFTARSGTAIVRRELRRTMKNLGDYDAPLRTRYKALVAAGRDAPETDWLETFARAEQKHEEFTRYQEQFERFDLAALRLAIEDLGASFPEAYPAPAYLARLDAIAPNMTALREGLAKGDPDAVARSQALLSLRREALMANPLLDFSGLLLVRRHEDSPQLGLPANWQGNCSLPAGGQVNDLAVLSPITPDGMIETLYRPETPRFVGDVDLHFDADRLLFSMPDDRGRFQIWEIGIDGTGLRQVTLGEEHDVDNYDACYLPNGDIIYGSTACYVGIPCVFGGDAVANLHRINPDGTEDRQLCFDQDHNWCPTMLNNGRVLYLRWEYTDLPHSNSRILFHMNPDGTNQAEYMHSNSYWPNGVFFARAIPEHPTKVVGIVTGHHGVRRMGELVVFDPALGRHENTGVVQRIPGRGEPVEPIIRDQLVDDSWPKFLHPYPLSEKYFLVSCKPTPDAHWGIYLVDTFDNMLLLREEPGHVLFEPVPIRKTFRPPQIPDKTNPSEKEGLVYMADVYSGPGLEGIPRGEVKDLRVFTYTFSHRGMGGLLGTIGMDGPWDIKRVLGTVPVEPDGSALFQVPANTPIAVHPLDDEGKALQRMRSWFTAMPGEVLSCVGCHEKQSMLPPSQENRAARRAPSEITPWYGPPRGFSFAREVQPVLDRHCTGCHNGATPPDLRGDAQITDWNSQISGHASPEVGGKFSVAYAELHRYVRRPGIESDNHLLTPMEYHANTTELVQILDKGHYGVALDEEAWDRIITWIDLNAPYHGAWTEILGERRVRRVAERRRELGRKYAGTDVDTEWLPPMPEPAEPIVPDTPEKEAAAAPEAPGWPFGPTEAQARQARLGTTRRTIDLGDGVLIELVLVPAGEFVMGSTDGHPDEQPLATVTIDKPFWMAATEVSNAQYARFDPTHDSRVESKHGYQFGVHGYPLNEPEQPVVRVSWEQAMAFCKWLSTKTGTPFTLPTEATWEYACRAGADSPFAYGTDEADFSPYSNLGDEQLARLASNPYTLDEALPNPLPFDDWVPRDTRFDDGGFVSTPVGSYRPNAWGLHDMHGNVWEWTRSAYHPYPYDAGDGRNAMAGDEKRVVRGGSWYDRPKRATASYRLAYAPWQRVFNVGFRVMCPADDTMVVRIQQEGGH
ncbi:MAG: SUMF1/EgtB/PvdO family nonheme iron enzyme [Candidatus Hydrogenedentota bacterium]